MLSPLIYGLSSAPLAQLQALRAYWTVIAKAHGFLPPVSSEDGVHAQRQNVGYAYGAAIRALLLDEECTVEELKFLLSEAPGNFSEFLAKTVTIEAASRLDVLKFLSNYGFKLDVQKILVSAVIAGHRAFLAEVRSIWGVASPWKWRASELMEHAASEEMRAWLQSYMCAVVGCPEDAGYHATLVEQKKLRYHTKGATAECGDHCIGLCDDHAYSRTPIALHTEDGATVLRPLPLDLAACLLQKQEAEHKFFAAAALVEQTSKRHRVEFIL